MEKIKTFLVGIAAALLPETLLRALGCLYQTQNLVSPGLAIKSGGGSPQHLTGAIQYLINGVLYTKAAVAAADLPATISWTGAASVYNAGGWIVGVDSGGNLSYYATNVTSAASAASALAGIRWPTVPQGIAVIGAIVVYTSTANTTFTAATTNLDATGLTTLYLNTVGPFYPMSTF